MKHKNIKKFKVEGEFLDDSQIPSVRAQYETLMVHDARNHGYVPVLDLDILWSTDYNPQTNRWMFAITVYTIYVGKRKARQWEGWSGGKLIPRSTQKVM